MLKCGYLRSGAPRTILLVEGKGSVKCRGDKESWAYNGLEDG